MRLLTILLVLLLCVLQYRLWFGRNGVRDYWHLQQQFEQASNRNTELQQRNALLHEEISDLKQGAEGIEERARNELGYIREGETFYRVIDPAQEAKP